jgi:membrane protease YdiL (CAAX protease family)
MMSTSTVAAPALARRAGQEEEVDRYEAVKQYSGGQIAVLWAAAAAPMSILAWIVAPWLSHHLGTSEPLATALLICFNAGLLWILVLTLVMVRLEQGGLGWARLRDALWLRAPQDPKTGRVGGKVWWWLVPFVLLSAALEALPINPTGPLPRDFPSFIADGGDRVDRFYQGAWGLFALSVLLVFLAPVVEELFFRGLLLPRMQKVCGRFDWIVNGTIFTAYHLHQPWGMPTTLLTGIFGQAYPAKRFRSIWISIVCHTLPSFLMIGIFLSLVLK